MTEILQSDGNKLGRHEGQNLFTIDGHKPQEVITPVSIDQLSETLRIANEQRRAVAPIGLGAFLHLGAPPRQYDVALSSQRLNHVVDYQPTDMTVTVEAGMPLAHLQRVLGEHGQWLPIDPPQPEHATIGGIIAANLSGPARLSQGTIRDALLGLKVVRADGTVIKGGGKVVKNVAGYDIPKLFCGSFGTLGMIVEATFKVLPRPEAQTVLALTFASAQQAMDLTLHMLGSELQPFFLELANFSPLASSVMNQGYTLVIGFAGITEEVSYQCNRVRELLAKDGTIADEWRSGYEPLLQTLQNFPTTEAATLRCKMSVLPGVVSSMYGEVEAEAAARGLSVQLLAHAGNGVIFCRFTAAENIPDEKMLSFVDWLRVLVKRLEGYVIIEDIDPALKARVDVWGHVGGTFPLMKRLKETFDPNGILNPGRFVGGI